MLKIKGPAGIWVPASDPTENVKAAWESLGVPRLGRWADVPGDGPFGPIRYPAARYPSSPRLNTVYWPTHGGAFAFAWVLLGNEQLLRLEYSSSGSWAGGQPWPLVPPPYFGSGGSGGGPLPGSSGSVDPNQPYPAACQVNWVPGRAEPMATMTPLRNLAILVSSYPQKNALWAVPFVDVRYFENLPDATPARGLVGSDQASVTTYLRAWGSGWFGSAASDNRDGNPPVDPDFIDGLGGPTGSLGDCLTTYLGRRGLVVPDGWADDTAENDREAQHVEEAAAALDAWLDPLLRGGANPKIRWGGKEKTWASPDLPYSVYFLFDEGGGTRTEYRVMTGNVLSVAGTRIGESTWPGKDLTCLPHFRTPPAASSGSGSGDRPNFEAETRRLCGRLLAWLTRPFAVVLAGAVLPCRSAYVGLWEWRTDTVETVAHGLFADTIWWGSETARGGVSTVAVIEPLDDGATPPTPNLVSSQRLKYNWPGDNFSGMYPVWGRDANKAP